MRIELDFGKFVKSYDVINKSSNKYLIVERSPAVLDAISRNPNPTIKIITEDGVQTGLAHVSINTTPVEVTAVISDKKVQKQGKNLPSSNDETK